MKEAFDIYFENLTKNCIEKDGTPPCKPVIKKYRDSGFYMLDTLDKHLQEGNKGYADWRRRVSVLLEKEWGNSQI